MTFWSESGSRSGGIRKLEVHAKPLELPEVVAAAALGVATLEVVFAEVVMERSVGEHVPDRHENGVLDGDARLPTVLCTIYNM